MTSNKTYKRGNSKKQDLKRDNEKKKTQEQESVYSVYPTPIKARYVGKSLRKTGNSETQRKDDLGARKCYF